MIIDMDSHLTRVIWTETPTLMKSQDLRSMSILSSTLAAMMSNQTPPMPEESSCV